MKNKLFTKITAMLLITTALSSAVFTTHANIAMAQTTGTGTNGPLLANAVAGKLMLKADIGYIYSLNGSGATSASGVGYGASLGWTNKSGFGLSADYIRFNNKWTGPGISDATKQYNYDASYNVVTLVPNYRIKLDSAGYWGIRLGVGVGLSISDVNWVSQASASGGAQQNGVKVASAASYAVTKSKGGPAITVSPSDFGLSSDPMFGGNCAVTNGNFSTAMIFSDSKGAPLATGAGMQLGDGSNRCTVTANNNHVAGFSNAQIANALITGKIQLSDIRMENPVAYGVWSVFLQGNPVASAIVDFNRATALGFFEAGNTVYVATALWNQLDTAVQGYLTAAGAVAGEAPVTPSVTKDDLGFVIIPQVAVEYDNNLLHADINVKYIHELFNVRYAGNEALALASAQGTYASKAGPLALFIGAGLGINF
ncbi:MAG: hypothetical protein QM529_05120 [Hydrotalea sp.]|nr:hypothetical protein [Hydrotalea sp.]